MIEDSKKEQRALLCVRSLANIAKDLKVLDQEILGEMCLFIANGILQVYRNPEMPIGQVHGHAPHDTDIKNEILNVVQQVKAGFAEKKPVAEKDNFVPEGGHTFLKDLNEKCCSAEKDKMQQFETPENEGECG